MITDSITVDDDIKYSIGRIVVDGSLDCCCCRGAVVRCCCWRMMFNLCLCLFGLLLLLLRLLTSTMGCYQPMMRNRSLVNGSTDNGLVRMSASWSSDAMC